MTNVQSFSLYRLWQEQVKDIPAFAEELDSIRDNPEEIKDRFYRSLEFGTAGLRGVLGLGTNRMNLYTVGQATQGLADYLNAHCESPSAAIAYDSRICSDLFAEETARILAANGVEVWLYRELMPTPALSYAVRELGCDAGVVITASHNPAKYNGYKAYGSDGSQLSPEAADAVTAYIGKIDIFSGVRRVEFADALADGRITYISEKFVQDYINRVFAEAINPSVCREAGLRLVYTPLNGAGSRCVRTVLQWAGVTDITIVPEQELPDGSFPTCPYPNPETPEALALGLRLCRQSGADLLLATDPDADRVAVAVRAGEEYRILTGNEVGALLLDYICRARQEAGTMPPQPVAVRSIVSSKLADAVAGGYGVEMRSVLTGFRFIGEAIRQLEQEGQPERYIFGFEESCGYLSGSYVRDKDAVNASLLLVEMASACKLEGRTLADLLDDIYSRCGIWRNRVDSFAFEGAQGMAKMASIMEELRQNPPADFAGDAVVAVTDYSLRQRREGDIVTPTGLPESNVLEYGLQNGCTLIVRPSGTEPKLKVYYSLTAATAVQVDSLEARYQGACAAIIK